MTNITDERVKAVIAAYRELAVFEVDYDRDIHAIREGIRRADAAAWRPFSDAPEDGTIIDVYRPDAGVFSAHYVEEDAHISSQHSPPEGNYYWFSTNGDDLTGDLPTMFRYRPTPPKEPQ